MMMMMRPLCLLLILLVVLTLAKKPSRSRAATSTTGRRTAAASTSRSGGRGASPGPSTRRRTIVEEEFDNGEEELGILIEEDDDYEEEEEEDDYDPRRPPPRRPPPSSRTARDAAVRPRKHARPRYTDEEEDDFPPPRRGPPRRGGRPPQSVVPYGRGPPPGPSTFARGLDVLRSSLPDPSTVKNAAFSSIKAARETTSGVTANLYREIKGLTSSELEQVMLKATRPDDTAVKGKHVERLVGVTYQISARYDIYDAVLRKLWAKMAEKDWRTNIKALYILHRFSADGAPDHAAALKARLRELRRTRDPKRKDKYFNSKQLLAGDATPENAKFRAFMARYAHYVLLRTQCFGGMFDEIGTLPKPDKKKGPKPITSTCLRAEHLDAATMLLKAGVACQLKDGEECENTAIAAERVASDLIGLTSAVAMALNRALKDEDLKGADPALLKKWCAFYKDDLQPQTRSMVKKTSPKLDAYGLFLPSRMGTTVSKEVLDRGLSLDASAVSSRPAVEEESAASEEGTATIDERGDVAVEEAEPEVAEARDEPAEDEVVEEEAGVDEEYEYEEEEYYDDEEY